MPLAQDGLQLLRRVVRAVELRESLGVREALAVEQGLCME